MNKTVLGIFDNRMDAESAIDDLEASGYQTRDISILMRDRNDAEFAKSSGTIVADNTVTGAVTGGVIGGIAGLLIGIGAIVVPGVGALLIGGPLAAALGATGAAATTVSGAVTGVFAGGIIGALIGLGVAPEDAKDYEERIRNGGILVAVPAQTGQEEEVSAILEDNHADKIRSITGVVPEREVAQDYMPEGYMYAPIGAKGGKTRTTKRKKRAKDKNQDKND
ncbi:MAG TPA: general stress protein [Candidatus Saccharimonadales bacterium]|nr:general stress protein [Candidatus Saccharimonadales bacterium]